MKRTAALLSIGIGTVLFALAPPILKLLTTMGGELGLEMPGAISYCNVLFVGNMCAGIVALFYGGPKKIWKELLGLSGRTRLLLLAGGLVSAIYPALLFTGLERTSVINVVLLSRFNGIVFVIMGALFLGAMVRRSEIVGYAVMAAGVVTLVIMGNHGLKVSSGELYILLSTIFFALTEIVSRFTLRGCSIKTYIFSRNLISSVVFFTTANVLFGSDHFSEAFAGELWILMLAYSALAVVAAQIFWLKGTSALPVQLIANFQLLNPAFTILFAFLLLSEVPTGTEWVAMGIILAGMIIPRISGRAVESSRHFKIAMSPEMGLAGR